MKQEAKQELCSEREAELEAFLFGELAGPERAALEAHLDACAGCRIALEDARRAFDALGGVSDPPLPYAEDEESGRAWADFKKRLPYETSGGSRQFYPLVAMAAVLLVGVGIGRFAGRPAAELPSPIASAPVDTASVAPEALDALERAELLSDVGVRYVESLRGLLVDVMEFSVETVSDDDLLVTRERANELLADGRLLERALDSEKDQRLLRAIGRAELFLEELTAIESSGSGTGVRIFQASLERSELPNELAALDLDNDVSLAIEASGWIGWDDAGRKVF